MPVESFNQPAALGLLAVAATGAVLAAYFLRRRDLTA